MECSASLWPVHPLRVANHGQRGVGAIHGQVLIRVPFDQNVENEQIPTIEDGGESI